MDNRRKQIRRTGLDILLAVVGLVLLTIFLWGIQTNAAVLSQKSNSDTKLHIAQQRMTQNAEEAAMNIVSYDAFNQAKVDTIAWYLQRNPASTDLDAMCEQWGLSAYALMTEGGTTLKTGKSAAPIDVSLLTDALTTRQPVNGANGVRYYFAEVTQGQVLVCQRDVTAEMALLTELRSTERALSTLKVGTTGFVFAVELKTGLLSYHPDLSLQGRLASDVGLDPAMYEDGYDGWLTLNGARVYCMSRTIGDYLMAAVVPEAEMMENVLQRTLLSVAIFAIVITLLLIYSTLIRHEQQRHPTRASDYRQVGRLYLDRTIAGKLRSVALSGLVIVFFATFFMQTLASLSRQSLISETKLESVDASLDRNAVRIDELTAEYQQEYTRRAKNVAWTIAQDPTIIQDDSLKELAEKAQIYAIYIFDKQGRTVATNTVFKDFVLSDQPGAQSFDFWNVVKGYVDDLIQPIMQDDSALHHYVQYVGVKRLDAEGMVQLGMLPRRIKSRLETTELAYVLSNIAVENNGMLFSVNMANGTFSYYLNQRYIGRSAAQYGVKEAALVDGYTGEQTIDGKTYFVSTRQWRDSLLCIAVPTASIYAQRLPTAAWVTLASLILTLVLSGFLIFSGKPTQDAPQDEQEAEAVSQKFFRIFQPGGRSRVVQSAASRWNGVRQPWTEKNPEQKLIYITMVIVSIAVLLLVCWMWFFGDHTRRGSMIAYILSQKWEKSLNLFSITYAVMMALEVLVVTTLFRRLLTYLLTRFGARSETIGRLLDSFIKYASILVVLFLSLGMFGVDSTALITSAGILSLVVGLGAQSLIGDILAGIFIVFEGEFRVGDIVTIGDWRGTVLEIGIRTTKIESAGSDIKIFNNSAISGVINMTKQFSYAFIDVGIEYGESLERVESVLQKELPVIHEHLPTVVNGPFYKGVASLGDSSVNIRILAQCEEKDRVQLTRDLNREVKLIFDKHNISIPFPQVVVNQPSVHERATRNEVKAAKVFVEEQKELTKDIQVRDD